ncbi:hypothetical protein [Pseudomonas putida]|jgi:hypothetical protein|uniref:hypothetical protein n=1 Tax=Pseudomonas TaxID=286 RepID=UPI0021F821D2|nr:hypothetical protein [Pseudomonas putida]
MIDNFSLLGTDERYLELADPAVVSVLIEEIKTLRGNSDAAVTWIKELNLLFGRYLLGVRVAVISGRTAEALKLRWSGYGMVLPAPANCHQKTRLRPTSTARLCQSRPA